MKIRIFGAPPLAWTAALVLAACGGELDNEKELAVGTSVSGLSLSGGGTGVLDTSMPVGVRSIFLTAGQHTIETRNCSTGTDSVMHVLRNDIQVAYDDDSGDGAHSRVTLAVGSAGPHLIIVRSFGDASNGSCSLYLNNVASGTIAAGGKRADISGLRAGELLETVDNDGGDHQLLLLNGGTQLLQYSSAGGVGNGARLTVEAASAGTLRAIVGANEPTTLVRNDLLSGHDPDGDGLGLELEAAIGTCSRVYGVAQGFDCGWLKDAKDTDADGLSDNWELFGKSGSGPAQRLPVWGANPRHKDLFLEVDFMRKSFSDTDMLMQPSFARSMAAIYAGEVNAPTQAERDHIAATLKNPDGLPGIALHFDTGMDPVDPADKYLYGDWGGHNPVPPASEGTGQTAGAAYANNMHSFRKGVFRYLLGENSSGGGQCSEHAVSCVIPLGGLRVAAHEFGHTLGLGHSGPSHGDIADPNCKPNYLSIMNYAFLGDSEIGFSSGLGLQVLDNMNLQERNAGAATSMMMEKLASPFAYNVDPVQGWVDWNRDGYFQSTPVSAYVNYVTGGGGCEFTRYNKVYVPGTTNTDPSLVRVYDTLYAIHRSQEGTLAYSYSNDEIDCPTSNEGCNEMNWISAGTVGGGVAALDAIRVTWGSQYLLVATVDATGTLTARWFWPNGDGTLQELLPSTVLSTQNVRGAPSLAALPDGSIMVAYTVGNVMYTRRWSDTSWSPAEAAQFSDSTPEIAEDASPAIGWVTVPSDDANSLSEYVEGLYAVIPRINVNRASMYLYDEAINTWVRVRPWASSDGPAIYGRPAMAFVPGDATIGRAPRFYLHYLNSNGALMRMSSYANGTGAEAQHAIGLAGYFDNVWSEPLGHDLFFEPGIDSNLRFLMVRGNMQLQLRTHADGMLSHAMINWNDWEVLGTNTCITTAGASSSNPVTCHDWRWSELQITSHVRVKSAPEYCVHKQLNDTNNGNPLHLWTCRSGGDQMRVFTWNRTDGHINSTDGGNLCWHKSRADWLEGQAVHLWNCSSGAEAQKAWDYDQETGLIRARHNPSKCVVKATSSNTNGTDLVLKACDTVAVGDKTWELY